MPCQNSRLEHFTTRTSMQRLTAITTSAATCKPDAHWLPPVGHLCGMALLPSVLIGGSCVPRLDTSPAAAAASSAAGRSLRTRHKSSPRLSRRSFASTPSTIRACDAAPGATDSLRHQSCSGGTAALHRASSSASSALMRGAAACHSTTTRAAWNAAKGAIARTCTGARACR